MWHSRYLIVTVLGCTIHPRPSVHLRCYSRRIVWTKILPSSRVTCAAPRDSVEQGVQLPPEEDTAAKPVVSVATFTKNTNFKFNTKIRSGLIEADDNNAISMVLYADTVFPDRVCLKW